MTAAAFPPREEDTMDEETRWVQHISGQGEKWEVLGELDLAWTVWSNDQPRTTYTLPWSDYRVCEPPEKWVEVGVKNVSKFSRGGKPNDIDVYLADTDTHIGYVEFFTGAFRVKSLVIERRVPQ